MPAAPARLPRGITLLPRIGVIGSKERVAIGDQAAPESCERQLHLRYADPGVELGPTIAYYENAHAAARKTVKSFSPLPCSRSSKCPRPCPGLHPITI